MKNTQKNHSVLEVLEGNGLKVAVLTSISKSENTKEVENNLLGMAKSVSRALIENGYEVIVVNADDKMISVLKKEKPHIVFNLAERFNGKQGYEHHVAALLEMQEIPFTGSGPAALINCNDKIRAKELMEYYGISTPKFQVFETGKEKLREDLKFPLIVKPSNTHDSIGIHEDSVVYSEKDMKKKVEHIVNEMSQRAIVEEYIEGKEYHVAVLGNRKLYTLPIAEADTSRSASKILSYEMKWNIDWYKEAPIICPVSLPKHVERALIDTAIKAHRKLGVNDYSRVDLRLDRNNIPYVLEVNANPGLTEDCFIFHAAAVAGIKYSALIGRILEHAAERHNIPILVAAK